MGDETLVRSGTMAELLEPTGEWVLVDVGFASRKKSCGVLHLEARTLGDPAAGSELLSYGDLAVRLAALARTEGPPLHLVLEAPMSSAFGPDGSPVGRIGEKQDQQTRYWFVGLGCSVLVASLYLVKAVMDAEPVREVRLFEGMVTFKDRDRPSEHLADVAAMRVVLASGGRNGGRFMEAEPIVPNPGTTVASIAAVLGLDSRPPPIIQVIRIAITPSA